MASLLTNCCRVPVVKLLGVYIYAHITYSFVAVTILAFLYKTPKKDPSNEISGRYYTEFGFKHRVVLGIIVATMLDIMMTTFLLVGFRLKSKCILQAYVYVSGAAQMTLIVTDVVLYEFEDRAGLARILVLVTYIVVYWIQVWMVANTSDIWTEEEVMYNVAWSNADD